MRSYPRPRAHASPGRRGFTMIELLLAAVLGVLVVISVLALFGAIARSDARSARATESIETLSRLHAVVQRAARSLVMDQPPLPGLDKIKAKPTGRPRIILEPDEKTGRQRLELVLIEPPILGSRARAKDADQLSKFTAVRGAFELRPDPKDPALRQMYWVNYFPGQAPARSVASDSLIASNLKEAVFRLARTDENKHLVRLEQAEIGSWQDLPAFIELDVLTADGTRRTWMFEVGWSVVSKPGPVAGMLALIGESTPEAERTDGQSAATLPGASAGASANAAGASGSGFSDLGSNFSTPKTGSSSGTGGTAGASGTTKTKNKKSKQDQIALLELIIQTLQNLQISDPDKAAFRDQMLEQYQEQLQYAR